jgi:ADP-dependent NAD(P)H-hydrate dehydratase / NAD(P)H-hydrate epimerase
MRLPMRLLQRALNTNKSDFGHIFILAGSARYSGAAALCSLALLRSGTGLVTLGIPKGINNAMIKIKPKEVITLPLPQTKEGGVSLLAFKKIADLMKKIDILVIGPGLGSESSTYSLIRKVISSSLKRMVIDADGLNAIKGNLSILSKITEKNSALIMTPHPKEMSRLTGLSVEEIQKNRKKISLDFATKHKVTLVLKGFETIVASFNGNIYINKTGNPGMATAGSGDVLTGIIASFLAQGLNAFEAAKTGVYLHGVAGDLAVKEKTQISLIASDIIDKIPNAIKKMGVCRRSSVGRAAVL